MEDCGILEYSATPPQPVVSDSALNVYSLKVSGKVRWRRTRGRVSVYTAMRESSFMLSTDLSVWLL